MAAFISLCELGSWALLTFILTVDYTLEDVVINAGIYVGIAIISVSVLVGIVFNIFICKGFEFDKGVLTWK